MSYVLLPDGTYKNHNKRSGHKLTSGLKPYIIERQFN